LTALACEQATDGTSHAIHIPHTKPYYTIPYLTIPYHPPILRSSQLGELERIAMRSYISGFGDGKTRFSLHSSTGVIDDADNDNNDDHIKDGHDGVPLA